MHNGPENVLHFSTARGFCSGNIPYLFTAHAQRPYERLTPQYRAQFSPWKRFISVYRARFCREERFLETFL